MRPITCCKALGKFNGRLSQGGAVVDEYIYVISGQRRSLLSRRACETLNLVKLVAVDSVETSDYYMDKNPKLFGGLGRMSGGDFSMPLHAGHQGVIRCRSRAQSSSCTACAVERCNPSEPMTASETVLRPWQKVGTDMFVYKKATYLLVVDYASSYVEIAELAKTTSPDVILHLRSIFARHGIPETVVSDNGPQYESHDFARFASEEGFIHVTSIPRYPQSNGKSERTVM